VSVAAQRSDQDREGLVASYLGRPGLRRLLAAARERFEANGGLGGMAVIADLDATEAHELNGLLSRRRPFAAGGDARVRLVELDERLRGSRLALGLEDALRLASGPLEDRPAARAERRGERDRAWADVLAHPEAARPELAPWLEHARRGGGAAPARARQIRTALEVVAGLPAAGLELARLAALRAGGDAHALDRERPLGRLVTAALLVLEGRSAHEPVEASEWRALWGRFGVSCDELSCTVLALGLRPHRRGRGPLARRLRAAHRQGEPVVLTLRELRRNQLELLGEALYVCENPAVVAAAAEALGRRCRPLVCSAGWPSTAVAVVLDAAERAGMAIGVHADFDAAGVRIVERISARPGASPWRFGLGDYRAAVARRDGSVTRPGESGGRGAIGSPHSLEAALSSGAPPVNEEAVVDDLLRDLDGGTRRSRHHRW